VRPLTLWLQAFGPYIDRQHVDFSLLARRRLFLIAGPTGSGKTTLLDAICFALYGETSAGERDGKQMRCQLADPAIITEVTLDFALGEATYRVTRCPEQQRARLRGGGTTRQRAKATLYRLDQHNSQETMIAAQWTQVTEQVEQLLGFRSDQFRQSVLLPQGQFRRLLLADSRQRQQVLEALFQTEIFRRIEDALREEARELRQEVSGLLQQQRLILDQTSATSADALQQQIDALSSSLGQLDLQLETLQQQSRSAADRLARAQETARRIDELEAAQQALAALEAQAEAVAESEHRLQRARQAATLVELERRVRERTTEEDQASVQLLGARTGLDHSRRARGQSRHTLEREQGREATRQALRRSLGQLEALLDRAQELEQASEELDRQRADREQHARQCELLRSSTAEKQQAIADMRARLEAARELARQIAGLRSAAEGARQALTLARQLADARLRLTSARQSHEQAQRALDGLDQGVGQARDHLEQIEHRWHIGQAALLAHRLEAGEPCPVCGSLAHPAPATAEVELPADDELRQQRRQLRALERERDDARELAASHRIADHRLATEVVTLHESLRQRADGPCARGGGPPLECWPSAQETQDIHHALEREVEQTGSRLAQAEDAVAQVGQLEREVARLEQGVRASQQALEDDERRLLQAGARLEQLKRSLQQQQQQIPVELRPAGALEQARGHQRAELHRLERRLERAREADRVAGEAFAGRQEALRQTARLAEDATRRHRTAERELARRLTAAGFDSVTDYQEACIRGGALEKLDQRLQHHREQLQSARQRLRLTRQAAPTPVQRPDLVQLQQASRQAETALRELSDQRGQVRERLAQQVELLRRLRHATDAGAQLEQRYRTVGHIAEVATGGNALRVSFQRFVLGSLLDLVLEAASRRLRGMSRGRYDLQRVRAAADMRRAGGLDLVVHDSYSGSQRPAQTLSGGESFLAALSLALGLADVVAAHAGGTRLETIFIDEGFGSLDPEALELAYRTLVDLEGGQRLVGIISHVPELSEWIDLRLEVTAGRGGSTVQPVSR